MLSRLSLPKLLRAGIINIRRFMAKLPVSKALADKKCLVCDSGDEFTNTGFPAVDSKDRPYVRFRYGVGDWKKGTIVVAFTLVFERLILPDTAEVCKLHRVM